MSTNPPLVILSAVSGHADQIIKKNILMTKTCLNIKDGIYGGDLRSHLFKLNALSDTEKQIKKAIQILCRIDLLNGKNLNENESLSENDLRILDNRDLVHQFHNKEIIARLCDYLHVTNKKDRPDLIKNACSAYLVIFETTNDYTYLIRRLQLIRKVKAIFSSELNNIYDEYKKIIYGCEFPYRQKQLFTELVSISQGNEINEFSSFLENNIKFFFDNNEYCNARFSIDSLKIIRSISTEDWHIRRAISYELEGDHLVQSKVPNTSYPNISNIFLDGLHEINSIGDSNQLKQRLEQKVRVEQIENAKMIQYFGVKLTQEIDISEIRNSIIDAGIHDFQTGYGGIISIPIISNNYIENQNNGISDTNFSSQFFKDYVRINNKGCKIGTTQIENFSPINIRNNCRERLICNLKEIKMVMDIDREMKRNVIFHFVDQCESRFIPEDRKYIFAEGLYAGFKNDFLLASHLLIPQIENSLKFIADQNQIIISKLSEDLQHDNTLGGTLEKIKGITDSDLHKELFSFLIDLNDINFRNEVCHGLMNPMLVNHYGIYLWWLSLKMIIKTKDYFSFLT